MAVSGYGLKVVQLVGGKAFSGGTIREFAVTAAAATNPICNGDLVTSAAGVVLTVATSPVSIVAGTVNTNTPIGVCVGVRFTDPVLKQTQHANFLPANSTGYASIFALVVDDPDVLFQARYDGAITTTSIGSNCALTFVAGNTTNGIAKSYMSGVATTATLGFRIMDIVATGTDPVTGTAFTDIIVKYNANTHAYALVTGQ